MLCAKYVCVFLRGKNIVFTKFFSNAHLNQFNYLIFGKKKNVKLCNDCEMFIRFS